MLQQESNAIDRNTIIQTIIQKQVVARHFYRRTFNRNGRK
mgnify:CR=1 FL=1